MFLSQAGNSIFNAYQSRFLTKSAVLVLNQISYYIYNYSTIAHEGKNYYYCTIERLVSDLGLSKITVIRSINQLRSLGILESKKLSNRKWDRTNYYALNNFKLTELKIEHNDFLKNVKNQTPRNT